MLRKLIKGIPCRLASSLALICLGMGCTSIPRSASLTSGLASDNVSYWAGDHMSGKPSVRIKLSEQRAYFYKGKKLAGVSLISSGREGLKTVTGNFRILEKDKDHRSSLFGNYVNASGRVIKKDVDTRKDSLPEGARYEGATMPHFMRIVDGVGMHKGYLPGYPASHGCIRMPGFMAEVFFASLSVGAPVSIED